MLPLLIALSLLSGLALGVGYGVALKRFGMQAKDPADSAGWDMAEGLEAQATASSAGAAGTGWEAGFSLSETKRAVREGRWQAVWPILLALGGLLGLMLFGSLALTVGIEDPLVGLIILLAAGYALGRTAWAFAKA